MTPTSIPDALAAASATDPGWYAFVGFAFLAIMLLLLMRNMNDRMRRMSYRQRATHRGKDDPQADENDVRSSADSDTDGEPKL